MSATINIKIIGIPGRKSKREKSIKEIHQAIFPEVKKMNIQLNGPSKCPAQRYMSL